MVAWFGGRGFPMINVDNSIEAMSKMVVSIILCLQLFTDAGQYVIRFGNIGAASVSGPLSEVSFHFTRLLFDFLPF